MGPDVPSMPGSAGSGSSQGPVILQARPGIRGLYNCYTFPLWYQILAPASPQTQCVPLAELRLQSVLCLCSCQTHTTLSECSLAGCTNYTQMVPPALALNLLLS